MRPTDPRPLIAHVVYRFDVGGLENGVVNLINRLPEEPYRHAVVALTEITDFRRRIVRDDVRFVALGKPPGHGIWQWNSLRRLFAEMRPAIVHTRNIAALEASLPAMLAGVPIRLHGEHGWDDLDLDGSNWKYRLTRRAYRLSVQHWIALSSPIETYLRNAVGVPPERVTRICNGVDTTRFSPVVGPRASIAGSPFNDPALWVVGTVGRLQTVKDQVTLVRAVGRAVNGSSEARTRMRLLIAGDGPQRDDVPAVLRGLDAFCLPSLTEGISNTVLESMATGLPIVATRVGGTPDLLDDGETGLLVPPADPAALGNALLTLFADPYRARQLGLAARAACERRFSLDRMVADYRSVYEQLIARQRAKPLAVATSGR